MPHESSAQFDRFVAAVHRRMVVLRAAERVGACVLGGCVVTLLLMPIRLWRGEPTGALVAVVLGTATLAGLLWGALARPTRLAAATEADRQLRLADLLSTALTLPRDRAPDDFERTVLALADAHSRQSSPSTVVLNRLGARGWGGVALALALVAGVSLWGGGGARSQARAATAAPTSWMEIEADGPNASAARSPRAPDLRRAEPGAGADEVDPIAAPIPESPPAQASTGGPAKGTDGAAGNAADGTGAGAGQSDSKGGPNQTTSPEVGGSAEPSSSGVAGGGGGLGTTSDSGSGQGNTGEAAGQTHASRKPSPPWRSETWTADGQAAEAAIRSGRVPDAYRDLLRGYFERE